MKLSYQLNGQSGINSAAQMYVEFCYRFFEDKKIYSSSEDPGEMEVDTEGQLVVDTIARSSAFKSFIDLTIRILVVLGVKSKEVMQETSKGIVKVICKSDVISAPFYVLKMLLYIAVFRVKTLKNNRLVPFILRT